MSRDHLKKRILKGAAYVAVVDDADVKREQILSALQVAAQDAGFRVEANGSIYGSSEISGFSVDEDMSFHDFQVVLKDAAHQIGSQFHVASKGRCQGLERFGSFPKNDPVREEVKHHAILKTTIKLRPPFPGKAS